MSFAELGFFFFVGGSNSLFSPSMNEVLCWEKGCLLSCNRLSSLFVIGECENLNELLEVVYVARLEELVVLPYTF